MTYDPTAGIGAQLRADVPYLPPLNGERLRLALGQHGEYLTIKRVWRDRHFRIHSDLSVSQADGGVLWLGSLVLGDHRDRLVLDDCLVDLGLHRATPSHIMALAERLETLVDTMVGPEMLSAVLRDGVAAESISPLWETAEQLANSAPEEIDWIVYPWLVAETITELDAHQKAGKTTLVMAMCASILGNRRFLDGQTKTSPIVYLTEQPKATFLEALRRADLLACPDLHVLRYVNVIGRPWATVVAEAVRQAHAVGARVLIVDTLSQFASLKGDDENSAGAALAAMEPLQQAAATGLGVLIVRHDRKSGGEVGLSARGSSAFGGVVDIIVQLRRPDGNARPTIRILSAVARFDETPTTLAVELQEDGTYTVVGDAAAVAVSEAVDAMLAAAPAVPPGLTLTQLLTLSFTTKRTMAQQALAILVADGRLTRTGVGKKADPLRWHRSIHSAATSFLNTAESISGSICVGCGAAARYTAADGRPLCLTCITTTGGDT